MENLCTLFGVPSCEKECTVALQQGLVQLLPVNATVLLEMPLKPSRTQRADSGNTFVDLVIVPQGGTFSRRCICVVLEAKRCVADKLNATVTEAHLQLLPLHVQPGVCVGMRLHVLGSLVVFSNDDNAILYLELGLVTLVRNAVGKQAFSPSSGADARCHPVWRRRRTLLGRA
jgi:hypothetical protein